MRIKLCELNPFLEELEQEGRISWPGTCMKLPARQIYLIRHFFDIMRLIYTAFILLLVLMTSAHGQQTTEDWLNKGNALYDQIKYNESVIAYEEAIILNRSVASA
jgi:hypothetical protein